ncbi:hypothetical protein PCA10_53880 [Metapseudomonas resinovorans NBRC 106553]|uniref:DUF5064 domain-containing protein n=2 Tax=Metapseudomonas resinovorans TaxID=53412 RepID=S6APR1_METRE|nr:DUF5064 family protein [Pseudomonas resinovorans]BAN51120.1 hypothetical protein PCA10_53880 [Pseudomonas resinovorans NBRC 106553]
MFRPGRIAIKREPVGRNPAYELVLDYEIEKREFEPYVNFELSGQIAGKAVHERFSLHGDVAYNFLQSAGLRLRKHGVWPGLTAVPELHADFQKAYADLRQRLGVNPGHPVDLERFLLERP